jgi:hypothetical protein
VRIASLFDARGKSVRDDSGNGGKPSDDLHSRPPGLRL